MVAYILDPAVCVVMTPVLFFSFFLRSFARFNVAVPDFCVGSVSRFTRLVSSHSITLMVTPRRCLSMSSFSTLALSVTGLCIASLCSKYLIGLAYTYIT